MKLDGELVIEAEAKSQTRDVSARPVASSVPRRARKVKEGIKMSREVHCESAQIPMRALAKIMTSSEELGLSCIGLSGISKSCGASQIAHGLARAFSDFGRSTLLVVVTQEDCARLPSEVEAVNPRLGAINVSEHQLSADSTLSKLDDVIGDLADSYSQIVVDLPPLYRDDSQFNIGMKELGSLCDATYLVCETAGHSRAELANAVDFCQLSKVTLAGWVLNDQKLKFQGLVSDQ